MSINQTLDDRDKFLLHPWNDGHTPGGTSQAQFMVENMNKNSCKFVSIYDDLLSEEWLDNIYNYAVDKGRPWGVYISGEDALNDNINSKELYNDQERERAIGLEAVRQLIYKRGIDIIGNDAHERIAGTAIWCLASGESNSVSYHIDYAELYRYETNHIHPPLYAGTCHLSPIKTGDMHGGDFMVNTSGLDHYKTFGYKGALVSDSELNQDMKHGDWITIRYRTNRGILHDGDYPHLSTPVTKLPNNTKRVILGFNCFSKTVSECCARAPEHSDAFNRTVKLYQAVASTERSSQQSNNKDNTNNDSNNTNKNRGKISAKDIMKNPALAKLLVLAANKIKAKEAKEKIEKEEQKNVLSEATTV